MPSRPADSFVMRLHAAMAARSVDQSELARRLGITSQAVNQWLAGETAPKGKRVARVAEELGVSLDWLLAGRGGLSETPAPGAAFAWPEAGLSDDQTVDLAARLEQMLREEGMPADIRTVTRLLAITLRDVQAIAGRMPLAERIEFVLSERRSAIRRGRQAVFAEPARR